MKKLILLLLTALLLPNFGKTQTTNAPFVLPVPTNATSGIVYTYYAIATNALTAQTATNAQNLSYGTNQGIYFITITNKIVTVNPNTNIVVGSGAGSSFANVGFSFNTSLGYFTNGNGYSVGYSSGDTAYELKSMPFSSGTLQYDDGGTGLISQWGDPDAGVAPAPLFVYATNSLTTNFTYTYVWTNTSSVARQSQNLILVDSKLGNDITASAGGVPFATATNALLTATNGSKLVFSQGTYAFPFGSSVILDIPKGAAIQGAGRSLTTLGISPNNLPVALHDGSSLYDLNIPLNGNIEIDGTNILLQNVVVGAQHIGSDGIVSSFGVTNLVAYNCEFYSAADTINFQAKSIAAFYDCTFITTVESQNPGGIQMPSNSYFIFYGGAVSSTTNSGFTFNFKGTNTVLELYGTSLTGTNIFNGLGNANNSVIGNWTVNGKLYSSSGFVGNGNGLTFTGTNTFTIGSTGYTNQNPFDVRVFKLQGTSIVFTNLSSGVGFSLGTLSVNNDFLTLHTNECLIGTGMTGQILQ